MAKPAALMALFLTDLNKRQKSNDNMSPQDKNKNKIQNSRPGLGGKEINEGMREL
jgi:hypothetical protein